jgi:hypothetical protein
MASTRTTPTTRPWDAALLHAGVVSTYAVLAIALHPTTATAVAGAVANLIGAGLLLVGLRIGGAAARPSGAALVGALVLAGAQVAAWLQERPATARFWDAACLLVALRVLFELHRSRRTDTA